MNFLRGQCSSLPLSREYRLVVKLINMINPDVNNILFYYFIINLYCANYNK